MFNNSPNYALAKSKAACVLVENAIIFPPISPIELAENYRIEIEFVVFKNKSISGFLDFATNKIYVNGEEPYNRNMFTIAHELGHHFLHRTYFEKDSEKYNVLLRAPLGSTKDPIEQEANAFAANLLVPKYLLDMYYEIATVEELADLFVVSQEVIRNRLKFEYGY
jgi:Zn-dependent peptidase ImmA (M78 family)